MKPATLSMWAFLAVSVAYMGMGFYTSLDMRDDDHQAAAQRFFLTASILLLCSVGCALIRAINRRYDGQVAANSRTEENAQGT